MNKVAAVLRLCRIHNCIALSALYVASLRLFSGSSPGARLLGLAWLAAAAFSYAYNDLLDISVDRINHPDRPLPSGILSTRAVRWLLAILAACLVLPALVLSTSSLLWPLAGIAGGILYSSVLRKRSPLAANLLTSALVTLVPFSAASGELTSPLLAPVCGLVFGIIFARELLKDLMDRAGDEGTRRIGLLAGRERRFGMLLYAIALLVAFAALVALLQLQNPSSVFVVFAWLTGAAVLGSLVCFVRFKVVDVASLLLRVAAYLVVPLVFASTH
jgi:geranylgeranylglycerol-phosphate geranylgeranyltransferase